MKDLLPCERWLVVCERFGCGSRSFREGQERGIYGTYVETSIVIMVNNRVEARFTRP